MRMTMLLLLLIVFMGAEEVPDFIRLIAPMQSAEDPQKFVMVIVKELGEDDYPCVLKYYDEVKGIEATDSQTQVLGMCFPYNIGLYKGDRCIDIIGIYGSPRYVSLKSKNYAVRTGVWSEAVGKMLLKYVDRSAIEKEFEEASDIKRAVDDFVIYGKLP